MSKTNIPESVKIRLWGKAAGRCQYRGCRVPLWLDTLTKAEFNTAYIAHIYADSLGGPRYKLELSEKLAADISNLMLMCDEHHRLIDKGDAAGHRAERLLAMKAEHEERIEILGEIGPELATEVILYGANVGEHNSVLTIAHAREAITPARYPKTSRGVSIGLKGSLATNRDADFWQSERANLRRAFDIYIRPVLAEGTHLSVFALAPQPLLVQLGSLLCDIRHSDVYQLHREPRTWRWDDEANAEPLRFEIKPPVATGGRVAVVFEISSKIDHNRVRAVLGDDTSIWSVTLAKIGNDVLRTRTDLRSFRVVCRELLREINPKYPGLKQLDVFPVMPVAAAIELGRVHMPKADPPLFLWDEQRDTGGFQSTFLIP
jgi:hypothetical protein